MSQTIREVDPATVRQWQAAGNVALVDVREAAEHRYEKIEGSLLMPLNLFEPGLLPKDKKVVFYCQKGRRSQEAAEKWIRAGGSEAYSLTGGIERWREEGFPVVGESTLMQQMPRKIKIILGATVTIGTLLGMLFYSIFYLIPLAVGIAVFYDGWKNNQWISKFFTKHFPSLTQE